MNTQEPGELELDRYRRGLRMAHPPDPENLARERERLVALEEAGFLARLRGYSSLMGPGYLQSALTLGAGTAAASLFAGAAFGLDLLWVAPLGMLFGIVMLSAVAHQTLSTGVRPFEAMRRFAGAPLAWGWAIGALVSSVLWHFPQYSLASSALVDVGDALGFPGWNRALVGLLVLAWAIGLSFLYGRSTRWIVLYERALKYMVWGIVIAFALVVARAGLPGLGELARGFGSFRLPPDKNGIASATVALSGLAAAVGINMVFLYPYSLLARGWGREHRRLARYDLVLGMFVPYVLATSLMVLATEATLFESGEFTGTNLRPVDAAQSLALAIGPELGRVVFNLGCIGMAFSSITLHMVCTGFVCVELFDWEVGSGRHRLAMLIPAPGVLGSVFWSDIAVWVAVPTNILCGFLLPIAYLGFIRLQTKRAYLGADLPGGAGGRAWLGAMVLSTLVLVAFLGWFALTEGSKYFARFT